MAEEKFLTTEEVTERYRGEVSVGTLENWRARRIGPPFVKIGKAVLYPIEELDAWDRRNLVACDDAKVVGRRRQKPGEQSSGAGAIG
ncbi:DNA-binding protein [Caulobacter vibrioides]|uniref:HTH transcriptional regulator n=1 Tax=Caulobacter vibrioides (strain NA1000 / CB15N) TaxID=565050 RepID=A0A0H3J1R4_CAUVN|nr:helix-turn-helix domain-containing protein [Caulobacter vibrioides]YP_009020549.1 HTH transcriptional regulator [Caulobacter vibrioides NA1000]AHI88580.1 HTH transcriptional regulator [Caulobacter vibrioides NA1000]AZH13787.1 DNA-binding protein [Caulobacter vibrioides]QXZ51074.1 helix-turn-helix domain-containing protein [Caulobacter vibrioides]